jgi:hypothetical protein
MKRLDATMNPALEILRYQRAMRRELAREIAKLLSVRKLAGASPCPAREGRESALRNALPAGPPRDVQ